MGPSFLNLKNNVTRHNLQFERVVYGLDEHHWMLDIDVAWFLVSVSVSGLWFVDCGLEFEKGKEEEERKKRRREGRRKVR